MFDPANLPLGWATGLTVVLLLALVAAAWSLRREVIYQEAPDNAWWRDLRIWATVLVCMQLFIYYVFS